MLLLPNRHKSISMRPGDKARTNFTGRITSVRIIARQDNDHCESGVSFRVDPPLDKWRPNAWYDAHWFEPEE